MICLPLQRTSDAPQAEVHWSTNYLKTVPGKIKCICLVFLLFGYLCERSSDWFLGLISPLYHILFWFAFNITCLLLFAYLFNVVPYYNATPWAKIEYYFCFGTAIALSFCTVFMAFNGLGWITVAMFSNFVAAFGYGYDTFSKKPLEDDVTAPTKVEPNSV